MKEFIEKLMPQIITAIGIIIIVGAIVIWAKTIEKKTPSQRLESMLQYTDTTIEESKECIEVIKKHYQK